MQVALKMEEGNHEPKSDGGFNKLKKARKLFLPWILPSQT
jgi:hypothetical protein